jgi:hypothetical protein
MYISDFLYSFICWWTFGLVSCPDYYEESCNKHGRAGIFDILISFFLTLYPVVNLQDCMIALQLFEKLPSSFPTSSA